MSGITSQTSAFSEISVAETKVKYSFVKKLLGISMTHQLTEMCALKVK